MTSSVVRVRVADLLVNALVEAGVTDAFIVTGGGAMHLNDAFSRRTGMRVTYCHHEQACAMAAESYARMSGRMAAVNVTTGPGGINALNGVYGAYTDSVPMVVISGQVKRETLASSYPNLPLRQLGDQEVLIVPMVKTITKFAKVVADPQEALYLVQKALWLARTGRPGPVWLDVPIDVQGALIDPMQLRQFQPNDPDSLQDVHPNTLAEQDRLLGEALQSKAAYVAELLEQARRPVLLAGTGIRSAGVHEAFLMLVDQLEIPVLSAWNAHDVLPTDHPLHCGRPGTVGDRPGNFLVQTADLVIVLGCRLNIRQISYNFRAFAKLAKLVMVDVDAAELSKPTLQVDVPIHADLRDFVPALLSVFDRESVPVEIKQRRKDHVIAAKLLNERYPTVLPEYRKSTRVINPYIFVRQLFDAMRADDLAVTANGSACVITFQAARLRGGQRLFTNSGAASMGYDLPAALGAAVSMPGRRVICLAGDGSIMMNLQELQTIISLRLPIKIFILNNDGYHSIRETQGNYFSDNVSGCDSGSGISFPDFCKIAASFGFCVHRVVVGDDLTAVLSCVLADDEPCVCEVVVDKWQNFSPKLASRRMPDGSMASPSLEDMSPFLPRDELMAVMNELQRIGE